MAVYRKVNKWLGMHKDDKVIQELVTPAGSVYYFIQPDTDVEAWLAKRGKLPDLQALRHLAKLWSARSVLSAG